MSSGISTAFAHFFSACRTQSGCQGASGLNKHCIPNGNRRLRSLKGKAYDLAETDYAHLHVRWPECISAGSNLTKYGTFFFEMCGVASKGNSFAPGTLKLTSPTSSYSGLISLHVPFAHHFVGCDGGPNSPFHIEIQRHYYPIRR